MEGSILNTVKKMLGIPDDYDVYDVDIIVNINSAFSTLHQLGVGPVGGFQINDESTQWNAFTGGRPELNNVKTYVYMRCKMLFDPPQTGHHMEAYKQQITELEWRLNIAADTGLENPVVPTPGEEIIDGGAP